MSDVARVGPGPVVVGRYALFDELASGGMGSVHLGRALGPLGRTVAVKRLHGHYLKDAEFVAMFMDEARIVARIPPHANVVPMVDLMRTDDGLFLVIEYVHGESLSRLLRDARKSAKPIPRTIVGSIVSGVLRGLHAAHETRARNGKLLDIVHRDVSPQNIMVGADGIARVLDFGIAKAAGRSQSTREGQIKGKIAYMAPEQIRGQVDRRTDVFAAGVVLWEMLAGRRLHGSTKDVDIVTRLMRGTMDPPSTHAADLSAEIDALVLRGIAIDPNKRYATAQEFAVDVERSLGLAPASEVGDWVKGLAHDLLASRAELVTKMEAAAEDLDADEFVAVEESSRREPLSLPRAPVAVPHVRAISVEPTEPLRSPPRTPEVPTTQAPVLFPAAVTNEATPPPSLASAGMANPIWLVGAALLALAVIGGALGGYALYRGGNTVPEPTTGGPPAAATSAVLVVEHPVMPPRAPATTSASATASKDESPPQSFSANPFMVPTPLARPSPTP